VFTIVDTVADYSRLGTFFLWAAISFLVAGFLGALLEVVFGPQRVVRWFFGLLLLAFTALAALAPTGTSAPAVVTVAVTVSALASWSWSMEPRAEPG
jgi:hypothetical protein